MEDKAKAMVLASFVADSLALGAHWIYDVNDIDSRFGRVEHLLQPLKNSYHSAKELGEFTHYGDQTLVLLESLASKRGFDLNDFAARWKALFNQYNGYVDKATRATLSNFAEGRGPAESGSSSTDFSGAARIAPLAYLYRDDEEGLIRSSRAQTAMTHNNPLVLQDAEFLARVLLRILKGGKPVPAMVDVRDEFFRGTPMADRITQGIEAVSIPVRTAIQKFGQSCDTKGALPSVVQVIARHSNDVKEALVENVMAGGDSAARGMAIGAVLGASLGTEAIPADWLVSIKTTRRILDLLEKIGRIGK